MGFVWFLFLEKVHENTEYYFGIFFENCFYYLNFIFSVFFKTKRKLDQTVIQVFIIFLFFFRIKRLFEI